MTPEEFDERGKKIIKEGEACRKRGYDCWSQPVQYWLNNLPTGCMIFNTASKRTIFLQGDEALDVEKQINNIWKQVRWKKIGNHRAIIMQSSILEEYYGEEE